MQLENTHFILLVLFYLNSIALIPRQPGSFDISPLAKHCWMLQHNVLYVKEWKTQKQIVVLVAFPATALLFLLNIVFCHEATLRRGDMASNTEVRGNHFDCIIILELYKLPFVAWWPNAHTSSFLFWLFLALLIHSGWRSSYKNKANTSSLLLHWEVLFQLLGDVLRK